jgi:hypothetical protein
MDFKDLVTLSGMTDKEICTFLNISIRTFQRYKLNNKAPKAIIECIRMVAGFCPSFTKRNDFTGWSFGNGYLWSPGGDRFTSGDVLARIYDKQLISSLERDLKQNRSLIPVSATIIPFPSDRTNQKTLA